MNTPRQASKNHVQCVVIMAIAAIVFAVAAPAAAEDEGLLDALKPPLPLVLCGEAVPLDEAAINERFEKEMLVSLGNRPQVILWLKRTTRYFPYIEKVLKEKGLPDDIKYLAIAESALRVHAGSPKGALGVWQLMAQTARKYGLVVNHRFDERRNPYLSTPAAADYLNDLHEQFGSWSLALAAYNMGEAGLEAEILEQGTSDYYRLYLPLETQRFVFRILAIKLLLSHPRRYGISLSEDDYYPPHRFVAVRVDALQDIPVRLIARAAGTEYKVIKDFNPEIRGYYLAAGTRTLHLPDTDQERFAERLRTLIDADAKLRHQRIYIVEKGDSLSAIADKFGVPVAALLIWNRIGVNSVIHPGQQLVIFPPGEEHPPAAADIQKDEPND